MNRHFYKLLWTSLGCLFACSFSFAQQANHQRIPLGKVKDLLNNYRENIPLNKAGQAAGLSQKALSPAGMRPEITIQKFEGAAELLMGKIAGEPASTVIIKAEGGLLSGNIVWPDKKKAYRYGNLGDEAYLEEVDIHQVICVDYFKKSAPTSGSNAVEGYPTNLESLPGAEAVVLLDFDGQLVESSRWNGGLPIQAAPSGMTTEEVQSAFKIVSEDYSPFMVNITTNESVYRAAPPTKRMRAIITPTTTAAPGYGGVALIGSFTWGDDTPCWVFNLGGKYAGETASHEVGHTLGLSHDGLLPTATDPAEEYYYGQQNWAPIMGVGDSRQLVQWSKGEYPHANNNQDDIEIITTQNGFSFQKDEGEVPLEVHNGFVSGHGTIQKRTDTDVLIFRSNGDTVHINANTFADQSDLDMLLTVRDANNRTVATAESGNVGATLKTYLPPGTYSLLIEGVKGTLGADSDYGSVGFYALGGQFIASSEANIAKNKPTATSSNQSAGLSGSQAVDDNLATRWSSQFSDPQWISVDLQNNFRIDGVRIMWESAYAKDFTIQVSPDGTSWQDIKSVAGNTNPVSEFNSLNTIGKFIRIYGTKRATAYGYSIKELAVYGTPVNTEPIATLISPEKNAQFTIPAGIDLTASAVDYDGTISKVEFYNGNTLLGTDTQKPYTTHWNVDRIGAYPITVKAYDNLNASYTTPPSPVIIQYENIALKKSVTTSSFGTENFGEKAVDGHLTTFWKSDSSSNQWLAVNLGAAYEVFNVGINWGPEYAADFQVQVSFDQTTWKTIKTATNNTSRQYELSSLAVKARYLRILCNRSAHTNGFAIAELVVNGNQINNQAPLVSITSPASSPYYVTVSPTALTLAASATDHDGTIARVTFYSDFNTLLGTDSIAPYTLPWQAYNGSYSIVAVAYDNYGASTTSAPVEIFVENANIALNKPVATSSYQDTGSTGQFAVDADFTTQWVSQRSLTQPQWISVNLEGLFNVYRVIVFWAPSQYARNFELQFSNDNVHWRTIRAITDNTSTSVTIPYFADDTRYVRIYCTAPGGNAGYALKGLVVYGNEHFNRAPTVSIASPNNGTFHNNVSPIPIQANAADADGTVSKVEFWVNNVAVAVDSTSPYTTTWTPPAWGNYQLRARAFDNFNTVTFSSLVNVKVGNLTFNVPGKIEAELYSTMAGIQLERTKDAGGGVNAGWMNANDWMDYPVNVPAAGDYTVDFRIASTVPDARFSLLKGSTVLATLTLPNTGGWQVWQTISANVTLGAGAQTLRLQALSSGFNLNWLNVHSGTTAAVAMNALPLEMEVFPNPANNRLEIKLEADHPQQAEIALTDLLMRSVMKATYQLTEGNNQIVIQLPYLKEGIYLLQVDSGGQKAVRRIQISR